uniref:Variant surface glycoprotein 1125.1767 n=1 Tax=Trypanosoma brucei TaxID=5691 RepID=A0A1J0R7Y7_9TRYP|nr:variant surface glycoprotein 1125.1767 [Trypanosoma brucei]
MWKKSAGLFVAMFLMFSHVSGSQKDIVNEEEFKVLCEFVRLTERISKWVEGIGGKSEVDVTLLKERTTDILFGTGVNDVNGMTWKYYRQLDCGRDSGGLTDIAGEALVKDLICLCEGMDGQPNLEDLCYAGNAKRHKSNMWNGPDNHRKTWDDLRSKCTTGRGKSVPTETELQENKKRLQGLIKARKEGNVGDHLYTYGGGKDRGLHTCSGVGTESDGICVLYRKGPGLDNASGIKWLGNLEKLVKEVEKMNKEESTGGSTKPSTDGKPSMEKKPKPNTKPTTGENSPAKGSERPQRNGNPNAQTTTSTETGATTARPPEEQKSSAKIILQSIWVFFFLLFV